MHSHPSTHTLSGIILMCGFCLFGPAIDMFAKLAADTLPLAQITAARFALQLIFLLPLTLILKKPLLPASSDIPFHLLRGALILMATASFFMAVSYLPLADALAIFFIEPFFLTFLAVFFLNERIGWRRVTACIIGFLGALLVIQPQYDMVGWPALLPIITALCFAFFLLLTRKMSQNMDAISLQLHTTIAATLILVVCFAIMRHQNHSGFILVMPDGYQLFLLMGVGLSATIAHLFLTAAFARAPVGILAPLQYLEIVTATFLGIVIFADIPNLTTISGVLIIISAGLYVIYREQKLQKTA